MQMDRQDTGARRSLSPPRMVNYGGMFSSRVSREAIQVCCATSLQGSVYSPFVLRYKVFQLAGADPGGDREGAGTCIGTRGDEPKIGRTGLGERLPLKS